jgi:uncharacterized protein (TIGR02466 family)
MPTHTLFVTQVYEASLSEDPDFSTFNAELAKACKLLAAKDGPGRAWCRREGYGGYTSFASANDLWRRAPVFNALKVKLDRHAKAFEASLEFDLGGARLELDRLWVNVMRPGAAHSGHIHPNSAISGTVYVTVPTGAGALKLEDPRAPLMMGAPPRRLDATQSAKTFVSLRPRVGTVLMWESWLRHEVPANRAATERVSLSFNYR